MYQQAFFYICSFLYIFFVHANNLERPRNYEKEEHEKFLKSKQRCISDLVFLMPSRPKLEYLMTIASGWRRRLASESKVFDWQYFGKLRDEDIISNFYLAGASYMGEKIDLILKNSEMVESVETMSFSGAAVKKFLIKSSLEREDFELTQILHFSGDYPLWNYDVPRLFATGHFKYTWWHTSAKSAKRIVELLENVVAKIYDEQDNEKVFLEIAKLHWWFSQASPYMRGSAAIAEVICQSLLDFKGFRLEKIPYLMIDIEVLCEPDPQEFIRSYQRFYREKV